MRDVPKVSRRSMTPSSRSRTRLTHAGPRGVRSGAAAPANASAAKLSATRGSGAELCRIAPEAWPADRRPRVPEASAPTSRHPGGPPRGHRAPRQIAVGLDDEHAGAVGGDVVGVGHTGRVPGHTGHLEDRASACPSAPSSRRQSPVRGTRVDASGRDRHDARRTTWEAVTPGVATWRSSDTAEVARRRGARGRPNG